METRQSLIDFVYALEARGISLVLRRNRLNAGAQQPLLTAEERAYINDHRLALKELLQDPTRTFAASLAAKEPTARSDDNQTQSASPVADNERELRAAAKRRAERDAYLKQHDPETWRVLHFNDPSEIARRNQEATDAMNSPHPSPIHNW